MAYYERMTWQDATQCDKMCHDMTRHDMKRHDATLHGA